MRELVGVTANSIKRYVQGTGRAWFNISTTDLDDPTEADPIGAATSAAIAIGATRGGFSFSAVPNYEAVQMDGVRESSVNSQRLIDYNATLGFSIGEFSVANLLKVLDRSKSTAIVAPNGLTRIEEDIATNGCAWPNYINNVALEVAYGDCDNTKAAVIVLNKVVNKGGIRLQTEDRQVGVSQVEFMAHYDGVKSPWQIWVVTPAA
jgi:hypothetical protein